MQVLLIYGEKDTGKTTTCHVLFNEIKATDAKLLLCEGMDGRAFSQNDDFKAVINYHDKIIGIYSAGDGKEYVSDAIDFGYKYQCDYLIACVRKGIHYNAPLSKLCQGDMCKWYELSKGMSPSEMTALENKIAKLIVNSIC